MIALWRRTRKIQFSLRTLLGSVTAAALVLGAMLAWPALKEYLLVQELRENVLEARTPTERADAFAELVKRAKPSSLRRLCQDDDLGIALSTAYWLSAEQVDRRDGLSEEGAEAFAAFLEERTGLEVPEWWTNGMSTWRRTVPVSVASGAAMMRRGGQSVILADGEQILVPPEVYESLDRQSWDTCAAEITPGRGFIYIAPADGRPSTLFCVDASTSDVRWEASVWALGNVRLRRSSRDYAADLTLEDGLVVVWGKSGSESCVEAFDAETGENVFRFCTANQEWSLNWLRSRVR